MEPTEKERFDALHQRYLRLIHQPFQGDSQTAYYENIALIITFVGFQVSGKRLGGADT